MLELNYSVLFAVSAATIIIGFILHQRLNDCISGLFSAAYISYAASVPHM